MLKFHREKRNELHELDRVMRVVGTLPCGLMVYVRTDEHAYAPHVHICDIKTRGCRFHVCVLLEGMMGKMVACAEKNEWTNFLLLADVCGTDTVLRVFCQCVVDRNDEAVVGIVRACAKARIAMPLRELAFECIGWKPKDAIEIMKAIEESAPGTCAALYDRFGRGLLWYSTYLDSDTMGLDGFQPFSRKNALAQFLLQCGCDPAHENVNGLAWEDLVDA